MYSKVIIILGIGKSGTSLLSKILHKNKQIKKEIVFNPLEFLKTKKKININTYDFYENIELKNINKNILQKEKKNILNHNVLKLNKNLEDLIEKKNFRSNIKFLFLKKKEIIFKDPRTLINFEFWDKNILYKDFICIFRNPYDFCGRYLRIFIIKKKKNINYKSKFILSLKRQIIYEFRKVTLIFQLLRSWYLYNNKILKLLEKKKIKFIVCYEDLYLLKPYVNVKINKVKKSPKNFYILLGKLYCKFLVGDIDKLYFKLLSWSKKNKITKILNI